MPDRKADPIERDAQGPLRLRAFKGFVLLGLAGLLLLPFGHLSMSRQRLQDLADAAAIAGGVARVRGEDPDVEARGRIGRLAPELGPGLSITWPPTRGRFAGMSDAVHVRMKAPWNPPLIGERVAFDMEAAATALILPLPSRPADRAVVRVE